MQNQKMVVNKYKDVFDIYIGRGSMWGNKFKIGVDGDREEVIEKFRLDLWKRIKADDSGYLVDELAKLDGKVLGCFCKPSACHGDVLVRAASWAKSRD